MPDIQAYTATVYIFGLVICFEMIATWKEDSIE